MTNEATEVPPNANAPKQHSAVPFGPSFFAAVLSDRIREVCDGHPDPVPVVELYLADGCVLDLCHIAGFEQLWAAVAVYRDPDSCEEMELAFVPYAMITRVSVSVRHKNERPAGFALPANEITKP